MVVCTVTDTGTVLILCLIFVVVDTASEEIRDVIVTGIRELRDTVVMVADLVIVIGEAVLRLIFVDTEIKIEGEISVIVCVNLIFLTFVDSMVTGTDKVLRRVFVLCLILVLIETIVSGTVEVTRRFLSFVDTTVDVSDSVMVRGGNCLRLMLVVVINSVTVV